MRNSFRMVIVAMVLMSSLLKAQPSENIFDPKVPVTWFGLDLSKARFIGPVEEFGPSTNYQTLMTSWNNVLEKEERKYDIRRYFRKKVVTPQFSQVYKNNQTLDFASMMAEKEDGRSALTKSDIQQIVNAYDFSGLSGLGLILNVESFNKEKELATIWVTFINLSSQEVIFTEQRTGKPGGAGVRNFWANSVFNMMEEIGRKDWDGWMNGNYKLVNATYANNKKPQQKNNQRDVVTTNTPAGTTPPTIKPPVSEENVSDAKISNTMAVSKTVKPGGKYYALLIGVSKYEDDRLNLDNPVKDARRIKKVLTEQYSFEPDNAIILEDPTRGDIFSALYKLRTQITINDNLLIFYAGHGYWDDKIKQGYWWPRDANSSDPSNWLSNSDLREQLRGITSAHTLLVSDACFSGGLFRTRDPNMKLATIDYQMLYKMPSRRAITSGTLTAVPDNSVFVEYFLKRLTQNDEQFLPAQQLFNNLRLAVINNSATVPQEGVIADTGDEGGDFIFLKEMKNN